MKAALFIGGPLALFAWFGLYSDLFTYGDQQPGVIHFSGVPFGGFFEVKNTKTYQCDESGSNCVLVDESTEVSEVEGLEFEEEPIEYREGNESTFKTKQPGMSKYTNIHVKRPSEFEFDWRAWKFMFEQQAERERLEAEFDGDLREFLEE